MGVNEYVSEDEAPIELLKIRPEGERAQRDRLARLRAERDAKRWEASLRALQVAAEGEENLMPHILEAVTARATLGEICDSLKEVFGTYEEPILY